MSNAPPVNWDAVLAAARPPVPVDSARARRAVEEARADYLGLYVAPERLLIAKRVQKKIVARASALQHALRADRLSRDYQDTLRIKGRATRQLQGIRILTGLRKSGRVPEREFLLERLSDIWIEEFGAQLTAAVDKYGKADGPFVRFAVKAAEGLYPNVTTAAVRYFVRQKRCGGSLFGLWR